jgi:hypothetical protein
VRNRSHARTLWLALITHLLTPPKLWQRVTAVSCVTTSRRLQKIHIILAAASGYSFSICAMDCAGHLLAALAYHGAANPSNKGGGDLHDSATSMVDRHARTPCEHTLLFSCSLHSQQCCWQVAARAAPPRTIPSRSTRWSHRDRSVTTVACTCTVPTLQAATK